MPSRAVAYSPDGSKIAIGFGTLVKQSSKQFDGKWVVLQDDDFQVRKDVWGMVNSLVVIHHGK